MKILRDKDIIYGQNDLELLHTFNKFPVFMGCSEYPNTEDILFDMNWYISKSSGLIQLNPLPPLDLVYSNQHGSGTTGRSWMKHHETLAEFIYRFSPNNILEIGGLHGILAEKYFEKGGKSNWTIIEPNPVVSDSLPIKVIKGFFDNNFKSTEKYDMIVHSHVFEHVHNPDDFINHHSSFMGEGDYLIFSVPNLGAHLKNKFTNVVNFEHTIFLSEPYIEYFLSKYNFEILDKHYFNTDHSIFYATKKVKQTSKINLDDNLYQINKTLFNNYLDFHKNYVSSVNQVIIETNIPVFLFGGHVVSQYLIAFGLETSKISSIIDNDPKKKGLRLYGSDLTINSPQILRDLPEAIVILRTGVFNEEIKKDILDNINPNVRFL